MKRTILLMGLLAVLGSSFAQAQTANSKGRIAACKVLKATSQDITRADVVQTDDASKSIVVTLTGPNGPQSFPADTYQFSTDGKMLQVQVAKFIHLVIVKGNGTSGKIGVALGAPPSDMICNTNW